MTMTIEQAIERLIEAIDHTTALYWERNKFTHLPPPVHEVQYSNFWAKIITKDKDHQGNVTSSSVYCFVCLEDRYTKTLGQLKTGDIHKPASWSAPAKHARGNVFDEDYAKCVGPNGVAYLR